MSMLFQKAVKPQHNSSDPLYKKKKHSLNYTGWGEIKKKKRGETKVWGGVGEIRKFKTRKEKKQKQSFPKQKTNSLMAG